MSTGSLSRVPMAIPPASVLTMDFSNMMTQVEEREILCKTPMRLKKLTKKTTPKNRADDDSNLDTATQKSQGKRRHCRYSDNNNDRHVKVETHNNCLLCSGEQYRDLFNRAQLCDMKQPRNKSGKVICLRWHTTGKCFHDCRLNLGHTALDPTAVAAIVALTNELRTKRKKFLDNSGSKDSTINPPGE